MLAAFIRGLGETCKLWSTKLRMWGLPSDTASWSQNQAGGIGAGSCTRMVSGFDQEKMDQIIQGCLCSWVDRLTDDRSGHG